MFFGTQEKALERLDEATDFLSKLMDNYTEDANTLTSVSKNLLLGLGNILNISSQDASVVSVQTTWYEIDKKKVLIYTWEFGMCHCFDLLNLSARRIIVILSDVVTLHDIELIHTALHRFTLFFPSLNLYYMYIVMDCTASHYIACTPHSTALGEITLHCTALYHTTLYCLVLDSITSKLYALQLSVLCCTSLWCKRVYALHDTWLNWILLHIICKALRYNTLRYRLLSQSAAAIHLMLFLFLSKSREIAQKALKTIWKLRDCLVVDEGDDEPVVITSRYLSMVLYRQENLKNETMIGDAETKFTLPSYKGLFRKQEVEKSDITSKIVLFKGNPYTWHISALKGKCRTVWSKSINVNQFI